MCGIFGLISESGRFSESEIRSALDTLKHRGPDDYGVQKLTVNSLDIRSVKIRRTWLDSLQW